ncbi:MAG TPA: radical SAM protein, partial [Planctomycetaceae bacterium]|nr:radical SAM protein [Planctomycetaceae bacterium]
LLADQARDLKQAGLRRLNVSLDTVRPASFRKLTRRDALGRVIDGIDAAQEAGFEQIRINSVAMRGFTEDEIEPLVLFCRTRKLTLRFIEFMPFDGEQLWDTGQVLPESAIRARIERAFGPLEPLERHDRSQPATDYRLEDGTVIGLIASVTQPFCGHCNRLRLTADGTVRNCLFSREQWDVRELLRSEAPLSALQEQIVRCIGAKKAGHGTDAPEPLGHSDRAMYQIGG